MSTSVPESSPTPKRKALHERQPSLTNPASPPPTLRLVEDEENLDIYSANPYPTKPEQVLLPPTSAQPGGAGASELDNEPSDPGGAVSCAFQDSTGSVEHLGGPFGGQHGASVSELSSIAQEGTSSSEVWLEDANSSKTSFGHPSIRQTSEAGGVRQTPSSDSSNTTLPQTTQTIKPVPADTSAQSTPSPPATALHHTPPSNGSSPNIRPLASSSPNVVPVSSSSPNIVREQSSDSSLYSANTVGTARRYMGQQWSSPQPVASYIYSDIEASSSQSIPSSPPSATLRTFQSSSSLGLPPAETTFTRARDDSSKESSSSSSDVQFVSSGGAHIQYPTVRAPSSTSSWADTSSTAPQQASQSMTERSGRWNPHLSTVRSEWSAERQLSIPSSSPVGPSNTGRSKTSSWSRSRPSIAVGDDSEDEQTDHLGTLRPVTSGDRSVSAKSSNSRLNSLKSISRPGSSASSFFQTIPLWARVYYKSSGLAIQLSALSLVEGSRPSTAATDANSIRAQIVSPMPTQITRPRTRAQQQEQEQLQPLQLPHHPQQQQRQLSDSRDPRAHWREGMEVQEPAPVTTSGPEADPVTWSPHLIPDRSETSQKNPWKPPSLDEAAEGIFSWRNAQIYSFCLGFIFPLAWLIASFLPLPQALKSPGHEESTSRPDPENALQSTVSATDHARYESAKWWRKVNRLMTPVGFAIIVVVIILAVLGSRGAL